jgi:hypothetical protein
MAKSKNAKTEPKKFEDLQLRKIRVLFKRSILNSILKVILMEHSGFRTLKSIKNINRLFNSLEDSVYNSSDELKSYIWAIRYCSKKWLDGLLEPTMIAEGATREAEYDQLKGNIINSCFTDNNFLTEWPL